MNSITPLSLYNCSTSAEFSELLQNEPKFNPLLPPQGKLPLLLSLMLDQDKEKVSLILDYGAQLMSNDIFALCEMQCNLNILEYTLEKSQIKIDKDVILKIADNPQLTDFIALLSKFAKEEDMQSIMFQLVNLDLPSEALSEVLTFYQKKGVNLKDTDAQGNNLLHLLYAKRQFTLAQFMVKLLGEDMLEEKNFQNFTPLDIKIGQEQEIEQDKQKKQEQIEQKKNEKLNKFVQRQQIKKNEQAQTKIKMTEEQKVAQKAEKQLQLVEKYAPYFVALITILVIVVLYLILQQSIEAKKSGNYID